MTVILIALLLQVQIALPDRAGLPNPASTYSFPQQVQKDYDKLWKRFLGGKEDTKVFDELTKALKKNPDLLPALLVQSYLDIYAGRPAEAEKRLELVLSRNPADPIALTYLADFAYTRGDYVRASEFYTRLRVINASVASIQTKSQRSLLLAMEALLQGAKLAIAENRSADAQKLYQQALNLAGHEPALRDQLSGVLTGEGKGAPVLVPPEDRVTEGPAAQTDPASQASIEDLGRWGNQIDHFREIQVSESLTREQLAALIARYFPELSKFRTSDEVVADVQQSWAQSAIRLVVGVGLLDSMANHTFQPARTVTRGEFAAVLSRLARLLGLPASTGPLIRPLDVVPDSTLYLELQPVLGYELMTLDNAGNFDVRAVVRGEEAVNIAEKLHRLLQKNTG
jgi:tetratricopeptide (TPR) repeat protein